MDESKYQKKRKGKSYFSLLFLTAISVPKAQTRINPVIPEIVVDEVVDVVVVIPILLWIAKLSSETSSVDNPSEQVATTLIR